MLYILLQHQYKLYVIDTGHSGKIMVYIIRLSGIDPVLLTDINRWRFFALHTIGSEYTQLLVKERIHS